MPSYRERVRWPGWFLVALGLALAGGLFVLGAVRAGPSWALPVAAAPFLLGAWGIWRLRFVEIEFGPDGAGYGFGGIRRRIPRSRILGAEARDYPAARYMGWGYRIGWEPRERAYSVLGCRRGVLVTYNDERGRRSTVFLSSHAPEKAIAALQS